LFSQIVLGFDDALRDPSIGAASAEITAHAFAHPLRVVARLPFLDQADRAHDLARRTEPALEAIMGDEGGLNGVQLVALRETLDRKDLGAVMADRESKARIDPPSIDKDRAGAALPTVATLFGSGQVKAFAEEIEQRYSWIVQHHFLQDVVRNPGIVSFGLDIGVPTVWRIGSLSNLSELLKGLGKNW
jgi:hypothetical protein